MLVSLQVIGSNF